MIKTIICLITIICLGCSQAPDDLILGKWKEVKREKADGRTTNELGKKFSSNYLWEFLNDGKYLDWFSKNDSDSGSYMIQNDILQIGNTKFKIAKLTAYELIIIQLDLLGEASAGQDKSYFEKVDEFKFTH